MPHMQGGWKARTYHFGNATVNVFLLQLFTEFGLIIQFFYLNPLNFYWVLCSMHTCAFSSSTKPQSEPRPIWPISLPRRRKTFLYVELFWFQFLNLFTEEGIKYMCVRLVCGTSVFLALTKVNYKMGFLHSCGPEKRIVWGLEKKPELALCSGIAEPLNFHWLDVGTKQKDLHPENVPQKLGKEAVPACWWGELRDTHLDDLWLLSSVAKPFNFLK